MADPRTDREKADQVEDIVAQVCAYADALLAGSQARFALVLWPEGYADKLGAVVVAAQPEAQASVHTALTVAAKWARAQHRRGA